MRHPNLRRLFAHWDGLRDGLPVPDRTALTFASIADLIGDTLLVGDARHGRRIRLAGSRACSLLGRELTGLDLPMLFEEEARPEIGRLVERFTEEPGPVVLGGIINVPSARPYMAPDTIHAEVLILPLSYNGRIGDRLLIGLGATSPLAPPFGLEFAPQPRALALVSYRFLRLEPEADIAAAGRPHVRHDLPARIDYGALTLARREHLTLLKGARDD